MKDKPSTTLRKTIETIDHTKRTWEVWRDFCEMSALAFANCVGQFAPHWQKREDRYHQIRSNYSDESVRKFSLCVALLIDEMESQQFDDILGRVFMELDLGSHWHGQFFTPYHLSRLMAQMTFDPLSFGDREFIRVQEPASGSGGMVIAFAEAMRAMSFNPQSQLHATCIDIDSLCVHMCYVQMSILGIPATVVHGNTLSLDVWDVWHTPQHVMGLWNSKLRRGDRAVTLQPEEQVRSANVSPSTELIDQMAMAF